MGIFMSIVCSCGDGEACGEVDEGLAGIRIPGMFRISCVCGGDDDGDCAGEVVAGILMPGMFSISVFACDGEGV